MYTQCACCVLAWVDIPTYRDMRGCALCILGCREQTNVFLFILLAVGSVPMNRCRHRIPRFFLSLFPPPSLSLSLPSVFTSVTDDKRIGSNTNTVPFHRRRNTLDCFFFLLRGSIYPVESDSLQFPKCNQRNGAWNSIAVHAIFNVSPNRLSRKNVQTAII